MFWFIDNPEDTVQTATNKRSLPYCATVFMQYFCIYKTWILSYILYLFYTCKSFLFRLLGHFFQYLSHA